MTDQVILGYCDSCKWSKFDAQGPFAASLLCRRYPPVNQLMPGRAQGELGVIGLYPIVMPTATCGEYSGQETQQ